MTELERLVRQIRVHYPVTLSLNEENDLVEMLNRKYSVTLRNNDSSTDNTSDEQLHSDEELMSKIEDMALNLAETSLCQKIFSAKVKQTFAFEYFQQQLKDLFKTHRNTVSTAVNQKDDNLVDEDELRSKMTDMLGQIKRRERMQSFMVNTVEEVDQLVKLFKTYQNSNPRPVIQQVDKYSTELELASKIEAIALNHCTGTFKWCSEISMSENEFSDFTSEVITLFKNSIEPVFRALNNSDEQSIVK